MRSAALWSPSPSMRVAGAPANSRRASLRVRSSVGRSVALRPAASPRHGTGRGPPSARADDQQDVGDVAVEDVGLVAVEASTLSPLFAARISIASRSQRPARVDEAPRSRCVLPRRRSPAGAPPAARSAAPAQQGVRREHRASRDTGAQSSVRAPSPRARWQLDVAEAGAAVAARARSGPQAELLGHLRPDLRGRSRCSVAISARTACSSDLFFEKRRTVARSSSCSSVNANSIAHRRRPSRPLAAGARDFGSLRRLSRARDVLPGNVLVDCAARRAGRARARRGCCA